MGALQYSTQQNRFFYAVESYNIMKTTRRFIIQGPEGKYFVDQKR